MAKEYATTGQGVVDATAVRQHAAMKRRSSKKLSGKQSVKASRAKTGPRTSPRQKTKKTRAPRTVEALAAMSQSAQDQWIKTTRVIQKVRREGVSVTQAAKEYGISRKKVVELGGSALCKQTNGRYAAKRFDRLLRVLVIPSRDGRSEVAVRDSRTASKIAGYSEAVRRFVQTGDASRLREFKKLKLNDASGNPIKLLTETKELTRLGHAGVLSFESLYARVA
jgi:hypothetical protein